MSVDWRSYIYDCDFNQMLDMPLGAAGNTATNLLDLLDTDLANTPNRVADHC